MSESFLHYLWKYRLFQMNDLVSDDGLRIEVIRPGNHNTGAGPDFFNAQLRIDGTLWAGNVEIHIHSSDWHRHNHHTDPVYDSCLLHVVYENDAATLRMNGTRIPTVELKERFPPYLWDNYLKLIGTRGWVACQPRLKEIDESTWKITLDRMITERMEHRSDQIHIALNGNKEDWQECFYQCLSRNFGFQLNSMPFEMVARSLPVRIIMKERDRLINIESLLFGQAGMLAGEHSDEYACELKQMYRHYQNKYGLKNIPFAAWKFLRLRPVNFPAIRIAQLSALLYRTPSFFNEVVNAASVHSLVSMFDVKASEYWNTHYQFNSQSAFLVKKLGRSSINNILINTCIPFIYAWGRYSGNKELCIRAFEFLREIPPEENNLITHWKDAGVTIKNAVDTQALLQLKIVHCSEKKCLTCSIGNRLINIMP